MKVSSLAGAIITPVKSREDVTPAVSGGNCATTKRFTPSKEALELISKMQRCHLFVKHRECFVDLRCMLLTPRQSSRLSSVLQEEIPDVPDYLLKMEEEAYSNGDFDVFLKNFLAQQLKVSQEWSFSALVIFNYSHRFGVSVEDSYHEIFGCFSVKTICDKCENIADKDPKDKQYYISVNNFDTLKTLQIFGSETVDDSYDDEYFKCPDEPSDSYSDDDEVPGSTNDPYDFDEGEDCFTNPFVDEDPERTVNVSTSDIFINPFCSEEIFPVHSSPINKNNDKSTCFHCGKNFLKAYNLKLHLGMMSI